MKPELQSFFRGLSRGVCHRGFHDLSRPENSLSALTHAIEVGYPFECDAHLSKDGVLVVNHDANLERVCGKPGIIEELTVEEIQGQYCFSNGEHPALLRDVLSQNHGKVPMVLELKAHDGNAKELAQAFMNLLPLIQNPEATVVISFSDDALRELRSLGCPLPLGWLIGKEELKRAKREALEEFDFLDICVYFAPLRRFRRLRTRGGPIICWTVHDRLTYFLGTHFTDGITWEIVNSAKPPKKEHAFLKRKFQKD